MIYKERIGNELYVYMNGSLLYKRWLNYDYGRVFCKLGSFISKNRKLDNANNNRGRKKI